MAFQFVLANDNSPADAFNGTALNQISATQGMSSQGGRQGLFQSGSTFVQFLYDHPTRKIRCYTSPDLVTWTELDTVNAPAYATAFGTFSPSYSVAQSTVNQNIFYVGYIAAGAGVTTQFLTLQVFNLASGWGAKTISTLTLASLVGVPISAGPIFCSLVYRPSDDSVFYIAGALEIDAPGGSVGATFYAHCLPNGSGWVNTWTLVACPDPATYNVNPLNPVAGGTSSISACLDTGGNVCVFSKTEPTNTPLGVIQYHLYFQRIRPDNTLGTLVEFEPANLPSNTGYLVPAYCSPSNVLYIGLMESLVGAIYTATSADVPVFTKIAFPVTAGILPPSWVDFVTQSGSDIALILEADTLTVVSSVAPFTTTSPVIVSVDSQLALFALAAIVPPTPPATIVSSPGRGAVRNISLNPSDLCLARDFRLLDRIDPTALSCHRRPRCLSTQDFFDGYQDGRIDHIPLPAEARRFFPVSFIALPATASGDVTVFTLFVPTGYDGYILGRFHEYTGPNFAQGSGDIVWRIKSNQRYLRDSGNMVVSLGSQRALEPIEGGIAISSGDLIKYIVSVPNLSGLLMPGVGNIICGLFGYFYPRT